MTTEYSLSLFKAATEVMDTGSLVEVDGFVIFTNSQGTQFFTAGTDDELTACEQDDVPASVLSRIKGRDFTDMVTSGCMFTYSPNLVDVVAVSAPKKPTVIIKKKRKQVAASPKKTVSAAAERPETTSSVKPKEVEMEPANLSVIQLLEANAKMIGTLSENLHTAQVGTKTLSALYGGQYRAKKARDKAVELGFIERKGKGWVFTGKALELGLGTQTRDETSNFQLLRFSPKLLEYIPTGITTTPNKVALPVTVIDPQGNKHSVDHVKSFCEKHGLATNKLYLLLNGSVKSISYGWKLAE